MWRNFFRTAFRNLLRNKLYTTINVAGLAAGITATLLAVLYWKNEHSFDDFHKNIPHLYRITSSYLGKDGTRSVTGNTGHVHGPAFKEGTPEVKQMVRLLGGDVGSTLVYQHKTLGIKPLWVDSSFFDVFSFRFLKGSSAKALQATNSVVLTESLAKKIFNSIDVVGKLVAQEADPSFIKLQKPLVVTAVIEDPPRHSSLQFDALFTFSFMELSFQNNNWFGAWLGTFVVLHPGANIEDVQAKFNRIYDDHAKTQLNDPEYNWHRFDPKIRYGLQPMTDIHFNTQLTTSGWNEGGVVNVARRVYSFAFMGIALFILIMAGINFININIAGSLQRMKEVGIRKILGSRSEQIIFQFLGESAILCLASFLIAILMTVLLLPLFNEVTGKQFLLAEIPDVQLLFYFLLVFVVVVLLTGLYPAFVVSRFEAVKVLYNKQKLSGRNLFGRGLVILQFSLAIFFLAATIVYYGQMKYIRTRDLGYNPSQIITTQVEGDRGDYAPILSYLKNQLEKDASVKSVAFGNHEDLEEMEINGRRLSAMNKAADENYLSLLAIPLLAGRDLSNATNQESNVTIVNEAFVRAAKLQNPIDETVFINRGYDSSYKKIIGVFKDYHFASLREPIKPMIIHLPENTGQSSVLWIKVEKVNQQKAIAAVEKIFKSIMPTAQFKYRFMDEKNAAEYVQEQRWQKVINAAAVLAFLLCSLGLFGLAHLSTQQRVKEVGVRKILGASVGQIVLLFSASFLKLVLIATVISLSVAAIVINKWLENFAYRVEVSWWMFALAGLTAIVIAFTTVSLQALKAAITNPVESLRME